MGVADWTLCRAGEWTHLSSLPAPFFHVNWWARDSVVDIQWRRYLDAPPFYSEGRATLQVGQNRWPVPPALVNAWWVNPRSDAFLRMT